MARAPHPGNPSKQADIGSRAAEVARSGRVLHVESLASDGGTLDPDVDVLVVRGDVTAGSTLTGAGSLVVEGSVSGRADAGCLFDLEGEVVVVGSLRHADIRARRISVGKAASRSNLKTRQDLHVYGDLVDARVRIGDPERLRRDVARLGRGAEEFHRECALLEQQVRMDEKRVGRLFQATRIACDCDVGRVLIRDGVGFRVDLAPFYEVVSGRSDREIDRALLEFYAKAIVGLLTRLNREYIRKSPSNQKVFTTALRKLHDLVFLARQLDKLKTRAGGAESDLEALLDEAGGPSPVAFVGGAALPDLEIEFASPEIVRGIGKSLKVRTVRAAIVLGDGDGPEMRRATLANAKGEDREQPLSSRDLTQITFRAEDGEVVSRRSGVPLEHDRGM